MRIDAYASSTEGFDEMLQRGIRHKIQRAQRFEKSQRDVSSCRQNAMTRHSDRLQTSSSRSVVSGFRFTHKAMESRERVADTSRSKNYAYAAILLSQLCQMCAAYALQHSAAVESSFRGSGK